MVNLDEFELDILNSVENNEWESKGDIDRRRVELQSIIKDQKKITIEFYSLSKFDSISFKD
ncbi:hypothetical protein MNB_SM-5-138 [hydrothermal vent metagenome]|uniref:Uncharacterized protein n=1 Tax=hydrothermal vent metagenome TaxID=652676 RepID=A0A1W1CTN5_9ZZZZ